MASTSKWGSHRSIGGSLILLVATLALPLNGLLVVALLSLSSLYQDGQRAALQYTSRAIAAGVDAELGTYIALANALVNSPALLAGDLTEFEAEARRATAWNPNAWVVVSDLDGRQLVNTGATARQPLPRRTPEGLAVHTRALASGQVEVSGVIFGSVRRTWVATAELAVSKNGAPFRTLSVAFELQGFATLLNSQKIPPGWIAGIIDRQGKFVARVPHDADFVGRSASAGFRASAAEGLEEHVSLEGDTVVNASTISVRSGWKIGVAANKADLVSGGWRTLGWAGGLAAATSLVSLLSAGFLARRIAAAISEFRRKSIDLIAGRRAEFRAQVPDLAELWNALAATVAERNRSVAALAQLAERFAAAEQGSGGVVYDLDAEADRLWISDNVLGLLGMRTEEITPTRNGWLALRHPEDRVRIESVRTEDVALADDRYNLEYRMRTKSGNWVWIWDRGRAVRAGDGRLVRLIGTAVDITERKNLEAELARSRETIRAQLVELSSIYDSARIGLCVIDRELRYVRINQRLAEINGIPAADHIGKTMRDIIPALADTLEPMAREIFRTGTGVVNYEVSGTTAAAPATLRTWNEQWMPLRDDAGEIFAINVVVEEITERKRQEDLVQLLMREVAHRSKNLLAVVQSIARLTANSGHPDFAQRFSERVQSLAASQDVIVKSDWKGADIADLIRSQLAHFQELIDTRIVLAGKPLQISPAAAQTLGMALHELATNASKYGALSNSTGRIFIAWHLSVGEGGEQRFEIDWTERDGPAVTAPMRRGFGTTVIETMARGGLSANVRLEYRSAGVEWHLDCPADHVRGAG